MRLNSQGYHDPPRQHVSAPFRDDKTAGRKIIIRGNFYGAAGRSRDRTARARIQARIARFELGNLGDHKGVGAGVQEARVRFGPGYRIYFGRDGESLVLLVLARLSGGEVTWRDAVETGTKGSLRTSRTRNSRGSFSWRPWTKAYLYRQRSGR